MSSTEMPIFTRTFDFIAWLLPATNNFPHAHRHTLTRRLLDAAFDLRERLEQANLRQARRLERLAEADEALARVRVYVRRCDDFFNVGKICYILPTCMKDFSGPA